MQVGATPVRGRAAGKKGKANSVKNDDTSDKNTPEEGEEAAVPGHVLGSGMEQLMGAATYAMQVVQPVPVAQAMEVGGIPGLAMGQVAYDANGNPLSAVPMAPPPQQ
mmetsp:Transcript_872/g.2638  ORF Transcript_872/g.2638 Transcript_872/m.2638 type:complete len:107 (-) Transcript_872:146-466(-)